MSRTQNRLHSLALTRGIMIAVAVAATANHAAAAEPLGTAFTYSGELVQGGSPVDDTCDFQFGLWNHPTDADPVNQVGSTLSETVEVSAGRFTVLLDFGSNIFTGNARWLEIAVCCPPSDCSEPPVNFTTLSPRQELTPTPYALFAADGNQGPPGADGQDGDQGPPGPAGQDGLNCWDLDGDGTQDPEEDLNPHIA